MKKYYFKNKEYGWGWYPASREGWIILAIFIILFAINFSFFMNYLYSENFKNAMVFLFLSITSIVVLITICWKTGEKPRWQWASKSKRK